MHSKSWHVATAALGLAFTIGATIDAQNPRFEAGVYYIDVPVRVIDAKGAFATGLTIDDFTLSESGTPQRITTFEEVHLGGLAGNQKGSPQNAPTSPDATERRERRAFYVVFDDYHLSRDVSSKTVAAVRQFVEKQLQPSDLVGVAYTSGERGQELTDDRSAVLDAITRLHGNKDPRDQPSVRSQWARNAVRAISMVLQSRAPAGPGHHTALVLITAGVDCVSTQRTRQMDTSHCGPDLEDAVKRALARGVTIYALDPSGAVTPHWESPGTIRDGRNGPSLNGLETAQASDKTDDGMRVLAIGTGGFTVTTEQLSPAFERIARETGSFYRLGYISTNDRTYVRIGADLVVAVRRKGMNAFFPASRPPVSPGAAPAAARSPDTRP